MFFFNKEVNSNKNETESKMENPSLFQRGEPCALAHKRIMN